MMPEIELYEALIGVGVSKDKARDVVLTQKEAMDQFLTTLTATLATKADLAGVKAVVRLGALMVVLIGLLGSLLALTHR